jgi:hypothetical protein
VLQTWSALVLQVTAVQAPIAVQAVQARLLADVHAVLSYVPRPQVPAQATHALPLK